MRLRLPVLAGLLLILAMPLTVAAHEITDVTVDCEGEAILVSGRLFGQDGGATVTVTGPDGYSQSFFADQDDPWTVSLPLGPDGEYAIDWPALTFEMIFTVDCAEGEVLPTEAPAPTSTPAPGGDAEPEATPAPEGAVLPDVGGPGGGVSPTLPPTDTSSSAPSEAGGLGLAGLGLVGLAAALTWLGLLTSERRLRREDREPRG